LYQAGWPLNTSYKHYRA